MNNIPFYSPPTKMDTVKKIVGTYFSIYDTTIFPPTGGLLFHVTVSKDELYSRFDNLRKELVPQGFIPILNYTGGEYTIRVEEKRGGSPWGVWVNVILLIATILTTLYAGMIIWQGYSGNGDLYTDGIYGGLYFALPLMLILGTHELGHYFTARRYHVSASLPFFIPAPPPFGTMGAFISLRDPIPDRKALMDIGIAGPLAGLVVALPVTFIGIFLSNTMPSHPSIITPNTMLLGGSFFWNFLMLIYKILPSASVNPMVLAGWVGLFVTAINLIPAGQLDGGHIARSIGGDGMKYLSWGFIIFLLVIGFLVYTGWLLFGFIVLILGPRHPPPLNDVTKLTTKRHLLGVISAFLLISMFVLVPLSQPATVGQAVTYHPLPPANNTPILITGNSTLLYFNVTNNDITYRSPYDYEVHVSLTANNKNGTVNRTLSRNFTMLTFENWTAGNRTISKTSKNVYNYQFVLNYTESYNFTFIINFPPRFYSSTVTITAGPSAFTGEVMSTVYTFIP